MTFAGPQSSSGILKKFMCAACKQPHPLIGRKWAGRTPTGSPRYVCAGCVDRTDQKEMSP